MDLNLSHQTDYVFKSANPILGFSADEKDTVWIPVRTRDGEPLSHVRPEYQ